MGFLNLHIPSQAIALANNKEVEKALKEGSGVNKTKCGKCLSNCCLPCFFIYVVASNTIQLFHRSCSLCTFFPTSHLLEHVYVPRESQLCNNSNIQTLCCKIFMLKYFVGHWTYENFWTWKFFQQKLPDLRYLYKVNSRKTHAGLTLRKTISRYFSNFG